MKHTNGRITYWMLAVWNKKSKWRLLFAGVFGYSLFSTVVCFVITADVKTDITKIRKQRILYTAPHMEIEIILERKKKC